MLSQKMNTDKIISKEIPYMLLDKIEAPLNKKGLTYSDLNNYDKVRSSDFGCPDFVVLNKIRERCETSYMSIQLFVWT